jgi:hypothetical protein
MPEIPPVLLSAIACEKVIFDKITGNASLITIIHNINAPQFPVRCATLVFFCELTNGHGQTNVKIKLVDVDQDDRVLFEQDGKMQFNDVKQIVTLAVNMQGIVFPREAEYAFEVYAENRLLGQRRIMCRKAEAPKTNGTN